MNAETSPQHSIASRGEFIDAARNMLAQAEAGLSRDITLVDADFSPWPLDEREVIAALTRWIRLPGRRLRLLGGRFDVIERDQSRFASWRKPFAHAIECWRPTDVDAGDLPGLLLLDATCLELLDREHWRAAVVNGRRPLVLHRERVDALMQRCDAAWPVTLLGL